MRINKRVNITYLLAVTLMGSLLILSGCSKKTPQSVSESATTVNIATAEQRDIYGSTSYRNRLKASSEVEVLPKTSERIISINVKEGQEVSAGQTLMTLDSSSLRASLKQAEAKVASAKATQVNNQIKLEAARKNYERTEKLFNAGAAAQLEMENAKDEYDSLQSGSVEAAVAEAQAALLAIEDQVSYCSITAPVSGIVGRIDVSVGDNVTTSKTVAVISDPKQMEIEVTIGESDISKMQLNSKVDVYVKSISENAFTGTVTSIASVLDANADMYPVTVTVDNSEGKIKSGMYAEVLIDTSSVQNALCIPLSAIIPSNGVNIVYTVNDENRANRVEVKTGINDDTYMQILSGLKAGDKVVTLGNTLISDGSLVTTKSEEGK
ncbi:MAG: efflux RND transporter periplasmic adaptor subunit [Syntrophomonadaceae bacterium]|nr:efflux RND transporter periplasmic adaptor subunit [Syntrophomonadaceae bacterium]